MKFVHELKTRLIGAALIATIALGGTPARAAMPLAARLRTIDEIASLFERIRWEEANLQKALVEHEDCLVRKERIYDEIELCIEKSNRIRAAAHWARRLTVDASKILSKPESQPLPPAFVQNFSRLTSNFEVLGHLEERLELEATRFTSMQAQRYSVPSCEEVLRRASRPPRGSIVIDYRAAICSSIRSTSFGRVTRSSFMTEERHVTFEDDEPTVISPGDSDGPESDEGNCIGRACGDGERGSGGNGAGEGRHAFNPDRYNKESVRDWAKDGGREETRPVPLNDDQIMELEHQRFEKEVGEKTWPLVDAGSAAAQSTNAKLDEIPRDKLYELDPTTIAQPGSSRTIISLGSTEPSSRAAIEMSLNDSQTRLAISQPTTWQGKAAKQIGSKFVDEGKANLASGDVASAEVAAEVAKGMVDIALGLTPGVGWAKDIVEAVTGHNYVTGADLTGFERGLAIFGAVSVGLGSKAGVAVKMISRIGKLAEEFGAANRAFRGAQNVARTAVAMGARSRAEFERFLEFSRRTFGNEIGSIGDGYDLLVKHLGLPDASKLWTSTKSRTVIENIDYHVGVHAAEFPGNLSTPEYVIATHNFIKNPPAGVLKKVRGTDRLFYEPSTNTFASATGDLVPRTMFKPKPGMQYWLEQKGTVVP